jgi:signal transduction histidine kinase/FixJ family two-component response regulator
MREVLARVLRGSLQGVTFVALVAIAMLWIGIEFNLRSERDHAERSARQEAQNLARLFEEHTRRAITEVDKTLLFIRQAYEEDRDGFDLRNWLQNQRHLADLTLQIALIGPDGIMLGSNIEGAAQRVDLSDREHFRVHVDGDPELLFVSKPVLGRVSGRWSVQLTRRVRNAAGGFGGVLVASLDPYRFARFYESIDIGRSGQITLVGTDRIIRAQAGMTDANIGRVLDDRALFDSVAAEPAGTYLATASPPHPSRYTAYRALGDLPLIVLVGIGEPDILATSARNETRYRTAGMGLTVALLLLIAFSTVHRMRLARTERALRRSREEAERTSRELEATLANIDQGIIMVDANQRVAVMNRRAAELLDLPEHLTGTRPSFQELLAHQWSSGEFGLDGAAVTEKIRAYVQSGGLSGELPVYERQRPNGTVIEVRSTKLPNGGVVRTYSDISERKRHEVALAEARDRAEAALRVRSAFLATMSHEVRTPLNGIFGMTALLKESDLGEEERHFVEVIQSCGDALLEIVNDVLDFSKLESGAVALEPVDFDPADLARNAADMLRGRASEKGLTLEVTTEPGLPRVVRADGTRLKQVLLNLISNAVKFTETGSVTLTVGASASGASAMLRFEVRDTGVGIPEEAQGRIFEEFTQADASITRRFGGTGLGLAICRRVVTAMGGTIACTSTEGVGSTFTVEVPATPIEVPAGRPPEAERPALSTSRALRILLVEDNPVNREVGDVLLRKLGHDVRHAENGAEAVERLRSATFDVVLMDMQMPVLDGLEATRRIRRDGRGPRPHIIGLTANAMVSDRLACLEAGMDDFVAKPVTTHKLTEVLARFAGPPAAQRPTAIDASHRDLIEGELGRDVIERLTTAFFRNADALVADLDAAADSGAPRPLAELLHGLKGAAAQLGYVAIVDLCDRVSKSQPSGVLSAQTRAALRGAVEDARAEETSSAVATAPEAASAA